MSLTVIPLFLMSAAACALACSAVASQAHKLSSPDGRVGVTVALTEEGRPTYEVSYDGKNVLGTSALGLVCADVDFSRDLKLTDTVGPEDVRDTYELASGKQRVNTYAAKRWTFIYNELDGRRLDVVFQISNNGVAFRYALPGEGGMCEVKEEATSFRLPEGSKAWLQPMSVAKSGWARTNPSYEEYYQVGIPVGTPSTLGVGWVFPSLFRAGDTWLLISESDVHRGYCGSRLSHESPGGEYRIQFPDTRETLGAEPVNPSFRLPYATPWRFIALGDLAAVTASTLGTDLAAPARKGAFVATPGKASWSWPKLGDSNTKYSVQSRFIDYAASMGWRYCLIDALWDKQISKEELTKLTQQAREKNVKLLVWYNSNGDWNDAFQTPKNRMHTKEARREEFARLRDLGIAGVKVDFFAGDGRAVIALYLDILEDAADFGLNVNFHGATLPRGWQRTYPNLLTVEAVRGYEFITFEQVNADRAPVHMAMLPFTRNVFDPMDFTPLCLKGPGKIKRLTTKGAELATTVLFVSGIQHYVEIPDVLEKEPEFVRSFLRNLPESWEHSRYIAGEPGDLAVFARQGKDGVWHIAGLSARAEKRTIEIDLAPLGLKPATKLNAIVDSASGDLVESPAALEGTRLKLDLLPYGGFVLQPAKE